MNTRIVYLDAFHLSDLLAVEALARSIGAKGDRPPIIFVHSVEEPVGGWLEANAIEHSWQDGIVQPAELGGSEPLLAVVRQYNKRLVAAFTEHGIPASSVQGHDRGLLSRGSADADVTWLATLAASGAVPVVSPLAVMPAGGCSLVSAGGAVRSIADRLRATEIVLLTRNRQPGIEKNGLILGEITAEAIPPYVFNTHEISLFSAIQSKVYLTNIQNTAEIARFRGTLLA